MKELVGLGHEGFAGGNVLLVRGQVTLVEGGLGGGEILLCSGQVLPQAAVGGW
jgi:hypothetical protein